MRARLAHKALDQAIWTSDQIDFSQMTDGEVNVMWYAAGELTRQAAAERKRRVLQRMKDRGVIS